MSTTALITGATGLLGHRVLEAFQDNKEWSVVGTGHSRASPPSILKADLSDKLAVRSLLHEVKPQVVVHCAANRYPDKCDQDPDGARRVNVEATANLVQACKEQSTLCIYISTDYVFPGQPGEAPYEAEAQPRPTNLYGQTKLDGEKVLLDMTRDDRLGVVLRVPVLYGRANEARESAVNVLLDAVVKSQDKAANVEMDNWAQRYPTNTEDVARVTIDIARKYLENGDERKSLPPILQFSSEDRFTKYQICEIFAEILGVSLDGMIAKSDVGDPANGVQRPYDTHLSTKTLVTLGISVRTQNFKDFWRREVGAYRR